MISTLTFWEIVLTLISALAIGIGKSGISGAGMISIPLMAAIFGGKMSSGFILPMLICADLVAVVYYRRHAQWTHLFRLLPWAIVGVVIALLIGNYINETLFRVLIAVIIIISLGLLLWRERRGDALTVPTSRWFSITMGLLAGFTSMIGNAAGPITVLYLFSMQLPKKEFLGTQAWFYCIINIIKLPLHIYFWKTITSASLSINLILFPVVLIGMFIGFLIIKYLNDKVFKNLLMALTFISALFLLLK